MRTLIALLFTASLLACANTKHMPPESNQTTIQNAESDYFIISQGGGFTGAYETFLVQRDGKIFQLIDNVDSSTFIGQLAVEKTELLFAELVEIDLKNGAISPAGNMNYSFTSYLKGTKHTLTWADGAQPEKPIYDFYQKAMLEVRASINNK